MGRLDDPTDEGFGATRRVPGLTAPDPAPAYGNKMASDYGLDSAPQYQEPVSYAQQMPYQVPYTGPVYQGPGGTVAQGTAPAYTPPKINYNSAEYLNGSKDGELDGTFHDQAAMYAAKLKRYVADYESQAGTSAWGKDASNFDMNNLGGSMGVDRNMAHQGIQRNMTNGMRGLNEDFAQRGMMNSGLWNRDFDQSKDQYNRQDQNLDQGVRNQLQTLNFNRGNQESDNVAQIGAARRDALNRLSQAQSLT